MCLARSGKSSWKQVRNVENMSRAPKLGKHRNILYKTEFLTLSWVGSFTFYLRYITFRKTTLSATLQSWGECCIFMEVGESFWFLPRNRNIVTFHTFHVTFVTKNVTGLSWLEHLFRDPRSVVQLLTSAFWCCALGQDSPPTELMYGRNVRDLVLVWRTDGPNRNYTNFRKLCTFIF